MEERFPTGSFSFRFFTTVLGIIFVNTHRLHIGTNLGLGNTTYKEHLSELFFDLMHNKIDANTPPSSRERAGSAAPSSPEPRQRFHGVAGPSPSRRSPRLIHPELHRAVHISSIQGWAGARQQRCAICDAKVSFCCGVCSSATELVVLHPVKLLIKNSKPPRFSMFSCISTHQEDLDATTRCHATGKSGTPQNRLLERKPK